MMLHTVYHGIMLGISDAERQELLTAVQQCGSQWMNDIESDNLYIIVGDNLSAVGIGTIEALKYAWKKAKIFSVSGFKSHIQKKEVDDLEMFFCQSKNKLLGFCHRNGDYFKWDYKGIYPGPSIFHHKKMDEESGVLATMGYHVGNSSSLLPHQRREILRKAYEDYIPFVEGNYMLKWGAPKTPKRLKRIAEYLVYLITERTEAQNQDFQDNTTCIADWESDLRWLKKEFYDKRH